MTKENLTLLVVNDIVYANFEYSCGGDDMGDTTIKLYNSNDENVYCDEIEEYIENLAYTHGDFYQDSDGYYMGEFGNLIFRLNSNLPSLEEIESLTDFELDNIYFNIEKRAEYEYKEMKQEQFSLTYSDELKSKLSLFSKYVSNVEYDKYIVVDITYIDDVIIPTNFKEMLCTFLGELFDNFENNCVDDYINDYFMNETIKLNVDFSDYIDFNENDTFVYSVTYHILEYKNADKEII